MSTITFKGVASDTLGIMITKTPVPPCQQQGYETIYIPDGPVLYNDKKIRENVSIIVEAAITDMSKFRQIYSHFQGHGNLILSGESDKYYKAICRPLTPENIAASLKLIVLEFECESYAYAVSNDPVEITVNDYNLEVGGSYFCKPVYEVYGSGNISLIVNNTESLLTLYNVDEHVTVDTALLMCHKDGVNVKSSGFLPFLNVGTNRIQFTGNVTKIEITKNERWL
ncbi:MAG: hypothetical protein Q4F95_07475 [Oscillospiraceae bacterium]|nr:hypothetical protein [Oscillospiraceae bacterium]